jgi:hypothetical protein
MLNPRLQIQVNSIQNNIFLLTEVDFLNPEINIKPPKQSISNRLKMPLYFEKKFVMVIRDILS